ncbi:hypothetical protein RUM44_005585 [Polyplax serrata]|uniref:Thioredoxin-like fold domain-containing protein n=1 Tax=Polyplax serrata TaxID=468196 RepID=A0ABR1ADT8_POLSC
MDFLRGKTIVQKVTEPVPADIALKKKNLVLYYFTSGDCDACRAFDVKLREVYCEATFRRFELAVIVVSCDDNKENFLTNIRTHYSDWYVIQFDDELGKLLTYNYGVTHVPTLIVVRRNGAVVTREGKQEVDAIGINVLVTWSE